MKHARKPLKSCTMLLTVLLTLLVWGAAGALAVQVQLPGKNIPQFVDQLPLLDVQGGPMATVVTRPLTNISSVELHMREFKANVMPSTFAPGTYTGTTVWGYIVGSLAPVGSQGTYIGPVFVAGRGYPNQVRYQNDLGNTGSSQLLFWKTAVDQTLHWADPLGGEMNMCNHSILPGLPPAADCGLNYVGPIPAVPHLHGGEVPPVLDGGPDQWFLSEAPNLAQYPDARMHGHTFYSKDGNTTGNHAIYRYPNVQEAAPLWFHDHLIGGTRLNVYAGLAGGYVLTDNDPATGNPPPADLDDPTKIIPLVIQDRMFDTNGELFFPNTGINPEHPFWIPEFVGDTIVVNGKVWPYLNVEPKRYRFLLINGSNARTYELALIGADGMLMWQIETDGGYLNNPVKLDSANKLVIMPGERAGIIIDFTGLAGKKLILQNTGRTPFPKGAPPQATTLGRIVQFRVLPAGDPNATAPSVTFNPAVPGVNLRPTNPIVRLPGAPGGPAIVTAAGPTQNVQKVRQLTLNEIVGPGGPLEVLLNNTKWDGKSSDTVTFPGGVRPDSTALTLGGITDYLTERPSEGETEVWEIVNITADAHPIHTHLTQVQLISRQNLNVSNYNKAYAAAFPGGAFIPAYGPPLDYNTGNTRALGGNPDVTPFLQDGAVLPKLNERGWKDTVIVMPGQVTKIAVRYSSQDKALDAADLDYVFDPNALGNPFVWHCHIVDHEDNEMMRQTSVVPSAGATRTYVQGVDY